MDRLLSELTDWLIDNHAISSDDKELYEYAIYSFIISTVPLVIFLVISGIIGMFPEGFLIIMPFMVIRKLFQLQKIAKWAVQPTLTEPLNTWWNKF
mgnify:CR=1 FL=1